MKSAKFPPYMISTVKLVDGKYARTTPEEDMSQWVKSAVAIHKDSMEESNQKIEKADRRARQFVLAWVAFVLLAVLWYVA